MLATTKGPTCPLIEEEQVQVNQWLDRLYRAIETTD